MSNYDPTFWTALKTLCEGLFPETSVTMQVSQANRLNWTNDLEAGRLATPYLLFEINEKIEAPDSPMDCATYIYPVTIYYVFAPNTVDDCQEHAEAICAELRDALILYSGSAFQCIPPFPSTDGSWNHPVNQNFMDANVPLYASMVRANLMVGETVL